MQGHGLHNGVVRLREWADDDSAWYAQGVRGPLIQRFTTESPTLEARQVLTAIARRRAAGDAEGFVICDAVTGGRCARPAPDT
jgi:[ribosomal protein S5]-alanine N-acetyltransferase